MSDLFDFELPQLPKRWHWVKGTRDGDPQAAFTAVGSTLRVHEAAAGVYTGELRITTNPRFHATYGYNHPPFDGGIPVTVFVAVDKALQCFYEAEQQTKPPLADA